MSRHAEPVHAPSIRKKAKPAATRPQPRELSHHQRAAIVQEIQRRRARAAGSAGLPTWLKAGAERLSDLARDVVRGHRESPGSGTPIPAAPLATLPHAPTRKAEAVADVESPVSPMEIMPKDKDEAAAHPDASRPRPSAEIATILRPGETPRTCPASAAPDVRCGPHCEIVAPKGTPSKAADKSECEPYTPKLAWNVVSADAKDWRANVQSMTLSGIVRVKPWPSKPTSAVAPNTPNPVDGGNITQANFQSVIDDMADYHTPLPAGGAGPWHSTAASHAHEWAHWNTDWVADSIQGAAGGHWSKANKELDALRQPKAASATEAKARTALKARVDARFIKFGNAAGLRWAAIPDKPGVAGSTGYKAGAAVLAKLIGAVRAYATRKGWLRAPAAPAPGRK